MISAVFAFLFGVFSSGMVSKQISYCECLRDNFTGKYCQSIKSDMKQGTCRKE